MATDKVLMWKIVDHMRDQLLEDLQTEISPTDSARVDSVTIGKYTESPLGINLVIFPDHPLGWSAGRLDAPADEGSSGITGRRPGVFPPESVGGSLWRYVLGTVVIYSLIRNTTQEEAIQIWECVKTRIANSITNDSAYLALSDDYGYHVVSIRPAETYGYAGGGPEVGTGRFYCDWVAALSYKRSYA